LFSLPVPLLALSSDREKVTGQKPATYRSAAALPTVRGEPVKRDAGKAYSTPLDISTPLEWLSALE
jgi:hypothetical protein